MKLPDTMWTAISLPIEESGKMLKEVPNAGRAEAARRERIVVADDEAVTRTFLSATLESWGYAVEAARDGTEAWQLLSHEGSPSLAIVDWMMPGLDGPALCRNIRKLRDRYVYVILLTSKNETDDLVTGLDAGADDYIVKPFEIAELKARLRAGRRIVQLEEELRLRATRDSLTGIWSRGAILDLLPRELERAKRSRSQLGLLMADLDDFKRINDGFGHLAGDAVLCEVGRRLGSAMRPYDLAGRYGGEEFLILLPNVDADSIERVAERVRLAIGKEPILFGESSLVVTLSIGAAVSDETTGSSSQKLIHAADAALYRAKELGKNRVELASRSHKSA